MSRYVSADIRFDFEGSLELARRLWALADTLDEHSVNRTTLAGIALEQWLGRFAIDFAHRAETERFDAARVVAALRGEANGWAREWKLAMDQENKILWQRQVKVVQDQRDWVERNIGDRFLGDDSWKQVPKPAAVETPTAPYFSPTATVASY